MKKSIKTLSLLLTVVLLFSSIASCDNKSNEPPAKAPIEDETGHTEHEAPTEAETEHTEHVGVGECEVCGIDYFDNLSDHIQKNGITGTPPGFNKSLTYTYIQCRIDGDTYIMYMNENDAIVIRTTSLLGEPYVSLIFTKSSMKYGEWEWDYFNSYSLSGCEGVLNPEKITPASPVFLEIRRSSMSISTESSAQYYAEEVTYTMINDFFIPLLDDIGQNLTPSDFGFVRFED